MIPVTQPFLPPIQEYEHYIQQVWDRNWLTNNGPLVVELEDRLQTFLQVPHVKFMTNGTITLQLLLQTLPAKGKILTTPFSYIATCSALLWEGFEPVFIDIDRNTFNADANLAIPYLEKGDIAGVLITHCFGVPCDVNRWDQVSKKYNVPVIYDAAHAFGVTISNTSVLRFGYASSLSFHATKLFHTIEGGAIATLSDTLATEVQLRRNFGHDGPERFSAIGVNGKNSEMHAAMGLVNLMYLDQIFESRKKQYLRYLEYLRPLSPSLHFQTIPAEVQYNYSYFPVVLSSEEELLFVYNRLQQHGISPRRYFYPALNSLPFTRQFGGDTPIAHQIAECVLCLPLYHALTQHDQDHVIHTFIDAYNQRGHD